MSLLSVVTAFCERTNLPVPLSVIGNTDSQIRQIRALLEEEGKDLAKRGDWEGLTVEATFTTVATEAQGVMTTIASNGFRKMKYETMWDRTNRIPVLGPVTSSDWAAMKTLVSAGPRYRFRIRGGNLLVNPAPTAGYTWAFEYVSNNWILNGTTFKTLFTDDADTILLPEDLVLGGLRWRYKKEKGFPYAEDFQTYEMNVKETLGGDGSKRTLIMDAASFPGVLSF